MGAFLREKHQPIGQDLKAAVASNGLTQMGSCFYSNDSTAGSDHAFSSWGHSLGWAASRVLGPRMGQPVPSVGRRGMELPAGGSRRGAQLYL